MQGTEKCKQCRVAPIFGQVLEWIHEEEKKHVDEMAKEETNYNWEKGCRSALVLNKVAGYIIRQCGECAVSSYNLK